ncbi:methyltransferase [Sporanaerobium hydrogeniformans]|uniref:Methyltransferase n=1 Tax=Sporanaerobium hydrogeniformans TaxID=3072179 RepID=A0AC61DDI1_9FIRM|nr:uroporphyrinogen decarboxylase family protein [Sporanaerobium hydrogeniformans]PHV70823.1 methyltransferase [Sporanaerobium hydrogeniformans]
MTSREIVMASVNHKQPTRIPVDLGATPSSGISAIAYTNLTKYLNMKDSKTYIYDVVQQVAQPEQAILDRFGIDVIDVGRAFNAAPEDWAPTTLATGDTAYYPKWFKPELQPNGAYVARDEFGEIIAKMPQGATFFDQTIFPYLDEYPESYKDIGVAMNKVLWQKLAHSPWDHADELDFWQQLRQKCIHLRNTTDKALMIVCGCNLFEWGTFLRRMDNFLMDIYSEPEEVERLVDALLEGHLATLAKVCEAVGDIVDIIRFGDDLGMDSGPFMSPQQYRTIFKPRHKMLCDYVHKHSQMKTFLHSCGSIYKLMPDLIDAGYDIINPVQTCVVDMQPERLKKEFGKDITFWGGGVDTRNILNRGTMQQVKDEVRRNIEILLPGGGFVFNTVHNIMPDVPPENIVAMFEAIDEYR